MKKLVLICVPEVMGTDQDQNHPVFTAEGRQQLEQIVKYLGNLFADYTGTKRLLCSSSVLSVQTAVACLHLFPYQQIGASDALMGDSFNVSEDPQRAYECVLTNGEGCEMLVIITSPVVCAALFRNFIGASTDDFVSGQITVLNLETKNHYRVLTH